MRKPSEVIINGKTLEKILEITEDAKRTSATSNKCRCDKAKVLGFYDFFDIDLLKGNSKEII